MKTRSILSHFTDISRTITWVLAGFLVISSGKVSAQWEKQNLEWPGSSFPWLTYPQFSDVCFLDADTGFAVGPDGMVMASTDGGRTWDFLDLQTDRNLYTINFSTKDRLWITGNKRLFRSPDRGLSWERIAQFDLYNVKDIFFLDELLGWVAADDIIFATTDGGDFWTAVNLTAFTSHVNKIGFTGSGFGWAVTSDGKLWLTHDNGAQWAVSDVPDGFFCHSVDFANNSTGYACGLYWPGGAVCKTTNGGNSWEIHMQYLGFNDILVLSPDRYIVVGEDGLLYYRTSDPGTYAHLPYTGSFCDWTSISRGRAGDFWVAGQFGGSMMHSTDGIYWEMKWTASDQGWNGVYFIDSLSGWAVAYEELWKTDDGGKHWYLAWFKDGYRMYDLFFRDKNHGWVVGGNARIFYTDDGGFTWHPKYDALEYPNELVSVCFTDPLHGWAANKDKRKILYTVNGGNHWEYLDFQLPRYINDMWFADQSNGWIVCNEGIIYRTDDGGYSWTQLPGLTFANLYSVFFLDSLTGYTAGANGKIQYTDNGGDSWTVQNSQTIFDLHSIYFSDSLHGWACGAGGTVIHTQNGGSTWTVEVSGTENNIRSVTANGRNKAWAAGTTGLILHADYSQFQEVPEGDGPEGSFTASIQPNPSGNRALVTYSGNTGQSITLRVYDLTGRPCYFTEIPVQGAREGYVDVPLANLPAGLYLVNLSDGNQSLGLKIIHSNR